MEKFQNQRIFFSLYIPQDRGYQVNVKAVIIFRGFFLFAIVAIDNRGVDGGYVSGIDIAVDVFC